MSKSVSLKAYAKINLSLDITGVLENSYHSIKSVFQSVSMHDIVNASLNNSGDITVSVDTAEIPSGENNIAYKAAKKFFDYFRCSELGADIKIWKGIPSQAGLGGGSADAAAVLNALNFLTGSNLTKEQLCEIGASIGADVPFCVIGGTVLAEGIGDIMTPLPSAADSSSELSLCIAKGENGISTPEAYRKFDSRSDIIHIESDLIVTHIKNHELSKAYPLLGNTFEQLTDLEDISILKNTMLKHNASAALMTGSGSAVFGIFENSEDAEKCSEFLKNQNYFANVCHFKSCGFEII